MSATADVLVVGSGAARLTAALNLAEDRKVAVIAKALGEARRAGRRVASPPCSRKGTARSAYQRHDDRGAGLNDREVVEHVVESAPRPSSGWSISAFPSPMKAAHCIGRARRA